MKEETELERCANDPYYFAVKYCNVPDTPYNRSFYDMIKQLKIEGKSLMLSKKRDRIYLPFPVTK